MIKTYIIFILLSVSLCCSAQSKPINLAEKVQTMNKSMPLKTDAYTTYKGVVLVGKTIVYKLEIDDAMINFVNTNAMKDMLIKNLNLANTQIASQYFITNHITLNYEIYNSKGELKHLIKITRKDLEKVTQ